MGYESDAEENPYYDPDRHDADVLAHLKRMAEGAVDEDDHFESESSPPSPRFPLFLRDLAPPTRSVSGTPTVNDVGISFGGDLSDEDLQEHHQEIADAIGNEMSDGSLFGDEGKGDEDEIMSDDMGEGWEEEEGVEVEAEADGCAAEYGGDTACTEADMPGIRHIREAEDKEGREEVHRRDISEISGLVPLADTPVQSLETSTLDRPDHARFPATMAMLARIERIFTDSRNGSEVRDWTPEAEEQRGFESRQHQPLLAKTPIERPLEEGSGGASDKAGLRTPRPGTGSSIDAEGKDAVESEPVPGIAVPVDGSTAVSPSLHVLRTSQRSSKLRQSRDVPTTTVPYQERLPAPHLDESCASHATRPPKLSKTRVRCFSKTKSGKQCKNTFVPPMHASKGVRVLRCHQHRKER